MLEFDLVYRGPLPCDQGNGVAPKAAEKQAIRWHFHHQIFRNKPLLEMVGLNLSDVPVTDYMLEADVRNGRLVIRPDSKPARTLIGRRGPFVKFGNVRFVPVVLSRHSWRCDVDGVILTRKNANIRRDTDNRLKVLRDALRIPHNDQEGDTSRVQPPDPCFCLLDDDTSDILRHFDVVQRTWYEPAMGADSEHVLVLMRFKIQREG